MADIDRFTQATQPVSLLDEQTGLSAIIQLIDGEPRLITGGVQSIESLKGFDPICDCWFYIGTELDSSGAGAAGDTVRVQIAAGDNPTLYPAIDLTYTLVAADAGDEEQLALNIANFLNSDNTFNQLWRAQRIQGNGCVYITAKKPGGQFERPNVDDFIVTSTGTTVVTRAQQSIKRQNKGTGLSRDPVDPRNGQLGTQASVIEVSGNLTSRFETVYNLKVDGSTTPQIFTLLPDPQEVRYVSSIAIDLTGNGVKFGQFGSKATLPTGLQINFKSNDIMISGQFLKTTDDLQAFHAQDPDNFGLYIQQGGDKLYVVRNFSPAIELRPQGEFINDDYVEIVVNDNLVSGISTIRAVVNGFNREF